MRCNKSLSKGSNWLTYGCFTLNVSKTVGVYSSIKKNKTHQPDILVEAEVINIVNQFKYLGIITDCNLNFKKHKKQAFRSVRANLINFRQIRDQLPLTAAKLFKHSMIFSHLSYSATRWSQAGVTTLKPIYPLYKQSVKTIDKENKELSALCHYSNTQFVDR